MRACAAVRRDGRAAVERGYADCSRRRFIAVLRERCAHASMEGRRHCTSRGHQIHDIGVH
ncbi:hypothetical protein BURMUCF2_1769 [Burkholderia multivorans CF2]|nr:hypothetical protein BURMUCF2_1769 [Burkholderia multivorans CF2]